MSDILQVLRDKSVLHTTPDKPFILKSGAKSLTYVDVRLTALSAKGLRIVSAALTSRMGEMGLRPTLVAGVALGGCPLATGVSLHSGIDALYVRPEPKDHGTGKLVEGSFNAGDTVVIFEDVITSGGSTLKTIAALRDVGLDVIGVIAVLDREQGGTEPVQKECQFSSLTTLKELIP